MTKTFQPLLAKGVEEKDYELLKFPLYASPKLDGIRVLIIDGVVMSRNLKPIRNKYVQELFGKPEYNGFDGEIIVGDPTDDMCYRKTNSGVMSEDGQPDVRFFVFDDCQNEEPFVDRLAHLFDNVPTDDKFAIVPQQLVSNVEEMLAYEQKQLDLGYEGIMLKDPNGFYKYGRSTVKQGILMKLKRFVDAEAIIIGFQERMHNANEAKKDALGHTERSMHKENMIGRGDMGALWVAFPKKDGLITNLTREVIEAAFSEFGGRDFIIESQARIDSFNERNEKFVIFTIGSGFDDVERKQYWDYKLVYMYKMLKFKYFAIGGYDLPRHPVALGLREDL